MNENEKKAERESESSAARKERGGGSPLLWRIFLGAGVCAVFIFLGFAVLTYFKNTAPRQVVDAPRERRLKVRVLTLKREDIREVVFGYGSVRALREADVTAEVSGKIVALHPDFEVGGHVEKDAVLARLDDEPYRLALAASAALQAEVEANIAALTVDAENLRISLKTAQEQLRVAVREYERAAAAVKEAAISHSAADAAKAAELRARAGVEELENRLRAVAPAVRRLRAMADARQAEWAQAQRALRLTEIRAPFSGFVLSRNAVLGGQASATPLGRLADLSTVEAAIEVPATLAEGVAVGAEATLLSTEDPASRWRGAVVRRAPKIGEKNRSLTIFAEVRDEGQTPLPRPGTFVQARLHGRTFPATLAVPRTALFGGEVFLADDQQRVRARRPNLEPLTPELLRATEGLQPGDRLILNNLDELTDGLLLEPEETDVPLENIPPRP
jgi:multidrug efflux pump subunit AcrA (membrane-fusion protein)